MSGTINNSDRLFLYRKGILTGMTNDKAIRQAIIPLFAINKFYDPCGVTLTMKQRHASLDLDPIECSRNFRHFSNRLNKAVLGNSFTRYNNRIGMIPILEKSNSQRYHYHTVIDRIERVSRDQFKDIVADCWESSKSPTRAMSFKRLIAVSSSSNDAHLTVVLPFWTSRGYFP